MKKNDFILVGALLLVGCLVLLFMSFTKKEGGKVIITVDGEEYKTMELEEDTEYKVELDNGQWNTFEIKDGVVDMIDASCPDKICVNHKEIHYDKDMIVCLPNNVVLQIAGGEESKLDAVAN